MRRIRQAFASAALIGILVNAEIFWGSLRRATREAVIQLAGIAGCLLWSRCQASLSPKVVHAVKGLRLGARTEERGLDLRLYGERGYNMGSRTSDMKYIIAVIQPHRLEAVREALADIGVQGLTVSEVRGFGRQKGQTEVYRGAEYTMQYVPKVKLEIAVSASLADSVVEALGNAARTGHIGDGKVFVLPLEGAMRVRTGEMGADAL
jgi:nitrogen regulatory protein PII